MCGTFITGGCGLTLLVSRRDQPPQCCECTLTEPASPGRLHRFVSISNRHMTLLTANDHTKLAPISMIPSATMSGRVEMGSMVPYCGPCTKSAMTVPATNNGRSRAKTKGSATICLKKIRT